MTLRRLVFTAGLAIMLSGCGAQSGGGQGSTAAAAGTQPLPPVPTAAPIALPTIAPEALTTDQINQRLDPFASPDCPLPCYNGLTPGDTTLYDALAFYARLGITASDFVPGDYQRALAGTGNLRATLTRSTDISQAMDAGFTPPQTNIYLNQGKVQKIFARYETYPASMSASKVIATLGAPDAVGLALLFTNAPNTPRNFIVQMVYNGKQTGFSYLGSTTGDDSNQQICLTDVGVRETVVGVFAAGVVPFSDNPPTPKILPIDTSIGIPAADFAATISAGGCVGVTPDQWLQWRP